MERNTLLLVTVGVLILAASSHGSGRELEDYKDHDCVRECVEGAEPKLCEYTFLLEYYYTLNKACYDCPFNMTDCYRPHCVPADGVSRGIIVANRMVPGPGIHICHGDKVKVRVKNKLQGGEGTSIHWHGILQKGTQYMDGVAMLTQCPIPAHSTFTYTFTPENPGTHFWHSHSGLQRSDGLFGHFVVREPKTVDVHGDLYDHDLPEHTILVTDWLGELSVNRFASHHLHDGDNKPQSMTINGFGAYKERQNDKGETAYTPQAVFHVKKGSRYRMRVVSSSILNCPIQFMIVGHKLHMIASDGHPFEPYTADSFTIFAGERFDFVLNATQDVGNYWMRVRGLADCFVKKAKQAAILRYETAAEANPPGNYSYNTPMEGKMMNPLNTKERPDRLQMATLRSLEEDDKALTQETPDRKFYLAWDFNKIDNYHFHDPDLYPIASVIQARHLYSPQINHISFYLPPSPPLGQFSDVPKDLFCNADTVNKNCSAEFCECVHTIKVGLGEVVELVLIDEGVTFNANHPMHLHGHGYRVIGMDRLNTSTSLEEIKTLDAEGKLPRNLDHAPIKDTVTVPDGGYTIIRFHADNPGFWLFHCHIAFHAEIGMAMVIQVGEPHEHPEPPYKFPTCGDWEWKPAPQETSGSAATSSYLFTLMLNIILCVFLKLITH